MLRTTTLHSGWQFIQTDLEGKKVGISRTEWLPASVPGHVHLDLMANGVIGDPFVRMNELGCQWVDEKDWSYKTSFIWQPHAGLPKRVLCFEGLDTVCTIYLNGDKVAEHDNMFVPLELDVTSLLQEGNNDLRIDFQSAVRVGNERRAEYFKAEGLPETTYGLDEKSFVRKAQYMYGWDWGPRLVSCGVYRPVRLVEYAARLTEVHVAQEHHEDGSVTLNIVSQIDGEGIAVHSISGVDSNAPSFFRDGLVVLPNPTKWVPRHSLNDDLEEEPLFTLHTYVVSKDLADELLDDDDDDLTDIEEFDLEGRLFDEEHQQLGVSEIKLLREKDEFGESFEFEVNGRKLWIRGANWIPDHSFPSIVTRERYREQLEKCLDMGFNMLRVWGGGLYETDDFYDICDELGILVWQDFPFACAYYPDNAEWQGVIAREAEVNIKRLRNRPCLALWCGNNENHQLWNDKWGGAEFAPPRYYGLPLYRDTLPGVLAKLDPTRSYIPSSGIGATTDTEEDIANRGGFGDQHNWDVWHGRGDWRHYTDSTGRFSSEYGFGSSCHTSVWETVLAAEDWDKGSIVARWHDKTGKGHETWQGFVKLHYPESVTLEDWVYYSQLNQRDALRYGVEHYRRSEFCKGSLIWQVNDCWPVQSWAILDCEGNYKALGYELRRLYADATCSIVRENDLVTVWAINDGEYAVESDVSLKAVHVQTGEVLREFTGEASLEPGERRAVLSGSISGLAAPDVLLVASWADDETWQLVSEPKLTRFGAPAPLTVSVCEEGLIVVKTETPLVDLFLTDEGSVANLVDNFVTLSEPCVFELRVHYTPRKLVARSLAGEHRVVVTRSPL